MYNIMIPETTFSEPKRDPVSFPVSERVDYEIRKRPPGLYPVND